ncbi:antibiotic biosynthesis monooxygenase family protein [Dyella flagellata]|uniref:Antibiotic biosynthesis monooxygenase n=1 Tax=Dyella flagellata TaxID=1867833 RepID=A0ABQ5XEJ9_9GAMM|nr:antibiotic biosynthesis monooxygenase [Dyella flagellata]GLQ88965.1 antibiotic biosynthesis monooxygenase [Dyella flagellata]
MSKRSLFAVVFEVKPNAARKDEYLQIAASLRPALMKIPGFLENERFGSRSRDGYLLSLSLWDNEKALVQWRTLEQHHAAQVRGREGVLDDYRIRVGEVTRVAGSFADRNIGWMRQDRTEVGPATALTIIDGVLSEDSALSQLTDAANPLMLEREVFEHLNTSARGATLASWSMQQEADDFADQAIRYNDARANIYAIRVVRDYGLKDRREAPQYYPKKM